MEALCRNTKMCLHSPHNINCACCVGMLGTAAIQNSELQETEMFKNTFILIMSISLRDRHNLSLVSHFF